MKNEYKWLLIPEVGTMRVRDPNSLDIHLFGLLMYFGIGLQVY